METKMATHTTEAAKPGPFGPMLDVVGISGEHGQRAVRYLRNRLCVIAVYDVANKTLRAVPTDKGNAHTYELMHRAIDATERHR